MFDISKHTPRLSVFKPSPAEVARHARKTGRPVLLTINRKAEVVSQDPAACQEIIKVLPRVGSVLSLKQLLKMKESSTRLLPSHIADFGDSSQEGAAGK